MTKYKEIVVDLETLGNGPNAAITSIGAVKFNLEDDDSYESLIHNYERIFFTRVKLSDVQGDIDGPTIEWWMQQSDEARQDFVTTPQHISTWDALHGFHDFFNNEDYCVWGNGSAFDNVILRSAYKRNNMNSPWSFRYDRDVRTIKYLAQKLVPELPMIKMDHLVPHCAIDDAISEVLLVQRCWRAITGKLNDQDKN